MSLLIRVFFLNYKNVILSFKFFFNIKSLRICNIVASIILLNSYTFIIIINSYINFSKCILIKNMLILIYKIFVNVIL